LGPAPQLAGRVGVDRRYELSQPARRLTERTQYFGLALEAMPHERADAADRGARGRAVRGEQRLRLERGATFERREVVAHVAIGRIDHHAARAARQQVAAVERAALLVPERDRVARVAGRL